MCVSRESALLCIGHSTYKNIKMADKFFLSLLSEVTRFEKMKTRFLVSAVLSDFAGED